ncbi:MAG: cytochrome b/b6 domain-containing protein [Alphaproteobacteria bacterium]
MPVTTSASYNGVAKTLHWLIALGIIGMLALGWTMTNMPSTNPDKFLLYQWHKSIGITILTLGVIRLVWRFGHTAPALPATMPRWERIAAELTHGVFYLLIIGLPLTGWAMTSTSALNLPTLLYNTITLPHLPLISDLPNKREMNQAANEAHELLAFLAAFLIVLHIGAAWKHHLYNRDDVLTRMAPKFMHGVLNKLRGMSIVVLALFLSTASASAAPWLVDYDHSKLGFVGVQGTSSFEGGFKKFDVTIEFDPAKPEAGSIKAVIQITSATAGSAERDAYLPQVDWFDSKQFPEAIFVSNRIHKTGENQYTADGTLTIKGISQPLALPFKLTPENAPWWRAQGKVTLLRNSFHIGEGQWANENYVKFGVDVVIDIAAKPAG